MEIKKQHPLRYYGKFVGPKTDEGYWDPENYESYKLSAVEFVVVHCTEGYASHDREIFEGKTERRVSINFYIPQDGTIYEYVPPGYRAWHAGGSYYTLDGKKWENFNNFSIGIELECRYVDDPKHGCSEYTTAQMESLYALHRYLQTQYPVLRDPRRTVGHEDISGYRGKTDPGPAFDWFRFRTASFEGDEVPPPPYSVKVDGVLLQQKLILIDGRSYLPLRAVASACGLQVKWFSQEKRVELVSMEREKGDPR